MNKIEFNPDGSIKLPDIIARKREENERTFRERAAIKVFRNQISAESPPKCELVIEASEKLLNPEKIASVFHSARGKFRHMTQLLFRKRSSKEFVVTIVSGSYRCSWCENFREFLEEEMKVPVINEGTCSSFTKAERKY